MTFYPSKIDDETKICTCCNQVKKLEEFHNCKRFGKKHKCKSCKKKYSQIYNAEKSKDIKFILDKKTKNKKYKEKKALENPSFWSNGGLHCLANLRPSCKKCNLSKHKKNYLQFLGIK